MDPETYSSKQRTEGKGLEGYYGYVDLGLSVKWAASNIGSVSPVNKQTSLDEMLQELEQEMNLQPMEKPSFTNKENSTYPAIMTYDEYLKSMDIKELYSAYNKYSKYCSDKTSAHNNAITRYNSTQYENHQYLLLMETDIHGEDWACGTTSEQKKHL